MSLHHLYRAMAFLGEEVEDQVDAPFQSPLHQGPHRRAFVFQNRDLFTSLDLVFFDTTSIYFEGDGGDSLGGRGPKTIGRISIRWWWVW